MSVDVVKYKEQLKACQADLRKFINDMNCHPILVRCAWHDSGTYDKSTGLGGADGSIRFPEELSHGANAGLDKAVRYVQQFKERYPLLSFADILQMSSAEAIHLAGGPRIPMRYGRIDVDSCPKEGNLPDAFPEKDAGQHLRDVFHRMGFSDKDIVALSGAHTLGRAFHERSGATKNGYGSKGTKYTSNEDHVARVDGKTGLGMKGGQSWTKQWLKFDNSYFKKENDSALLWLPTDDAVRGELFKQYYDKYAQSQVAFFADYASAHARLSELGSKWAVPGGIVLENVPTSKL